jgi:hypothetical protein
MILCGERDRKGSWCGRPPTEDGSSGIPILRLERSPGREEERRDMNGVTLVGIVRVERERDLRAREHGHSRRCVRGE